jgi:hypothetical protein
LNFGNLAAIVLIGGDPSRVCSGELVALPTGRLDDGLANRLRPALTASHQEPKGVLCLLIQTQGNGFSGHRRNVSRLSYSLPYQSHAQRSRTDLCRFCDRIQASVLSRDYFSGSDQASIETSKDFARD